MPFLGTLLKNGTFLKSGPWGRPPPRFSLARNEQKYFENMSFRCFSQYTSKTGAYSSEIL